MHFSSYLTQNHFSCTTLSPWSKAKEKKGTRRHESPLAYLEEDPKGDDLPITFLEEHCKDALLPHLVHDDDAQRGGSEEYQKQQHVGEPLPSAAGHPVAFWSELAPFHRLLLPHQVRCPSSPGAQRTCSLAGSCLVKAAMWRS